MCKFGEDFVRNGQYMKVHVKGKIKRNALGGHFVFQNEVKISSKHLFLALHIVGKIGEDTFNNGSEIKVFVKRNECNQTHGRTGLFYNLLSQAGRQAKPIAKYGLSASKLKTAKRNVICSSITKSLNIFVSPKHNFDSRPTKPIGWQGLLKPLNKFNP